MNTITARYTKFLTVALVASACLWVPEGVPVPVTLPADYRPPTPAIADDQGFTAISVGEHHTCAIRPGGDVECWGDNNLGQATPSKGRFTTVSVGGNASCAIGDAGEVACWGADWAAGGRPDGVFTAIDLADVGEQACGIRADGTLSCWSSGNEDPSYYAKRIREAFDVLSPPEGAFSAVSVGVWHACAVRVGGEVACWGANVVWVPEQDEILETGQARPPGGVFRDVSVGPTHSCAVEVGGRVMCWGYDRLDQPSPPGGPFVSVSAGDRITCGLRVGGEVVCWGGEWVLSEWGWDPDRVDRERAPTPSPAGVFSDVDAAGGVVCGLRPGGAVECWHPGHYPADELAFSS